MMNRLVLSLCLSVLLAGPAMAMSPAPPSETCKENPKAAECVKQATGLSLHTAIWNCENAREKTTQCKEFINCSSTLHEQTAYLNPNENSLNDLGRAAYNACAEHLQQKNHNAE